MYRSFLLAMFAVTLAAGVAQAQSGETTKKREPVASAYLEYRHSLPPGDDRPSPWPEVAKKLPELVKAALGKEAGHYEVRDQISPHASIEDNKKSISVRLEAMPGTIFSSGEIDRSGLMSPYGSSAYPGGGGFGGQVIETAKLHVYMVPEEEAVAEAVLETVVEELRIVMHRQHKELTEKLQARATAAEAAAAEATEKQKMLEQQYEAALARVKALEENATEQAKTLQAENLSMQLELAGARARTLAIEKQIQQVAKAGQDVPQHRERMIDDLAEIVKLREKRMAYVMALRESGQIPESELVDARERVLEAQVQLAQARADAARVQGGPQIEKLNTDLSEAIIRTAELEARLKFVQQRLAGSEQRTDELVKAEAAAAEALTAFHQQRQLLKRLQDEAQSAERKARAAQSPLGFSVLPLKKTAPQSQDPFSAVPGTPSGTDPGFGGVEGGGFQ